MFVAKNRSRCLLLMTASAAAMSLMSTVSAGPVGMPTKGTPGVLIWADEDGKTWHFKTHAEKKVVHKFSGTIQVAGAKISGATGIDKLEKGDAWDMDFKKGTVSFHLTTGKKGTDIVNLILTRCPASVVYDIQEDGQPMSPDKIHLGVANEHPTSSHFALPGK